MVEETLARALDIGGVGPPLKVILLTVLVGVGVKVGALALWRNTNALFSLTTYLKLGLLLAAAGTAIVVSAKQGLIEGSINTLTMYALVLAKFAEQTYTLLVSD